MNFKIFKTLLTHISFWILYIFYESLLFILIDSRQLNLWETGFNFTLYALIFYVNSLVLLPQFMARKKYHLFFFSLVQLVFFFLLVRFILNVYIIPLFDEKMLRPVVLNKAFWADKVFWAESIWRGTYFLILSFAYWFALTSFLNEQKKRILEIQRNERENQLRELEKNLVEAELAFLKAQINPHFLFNSLNFIYAQIYSYSESAAKSVLLLSDIIRYGLNEGDIYGKVMLEKEVQHLKSFIQINQLRFNQSLQVEFEVTGCLNFRMIMPLMLMTFVENCIKHGELSDPNHPITIRLEVTITSLIFYTHNKKRSGPKEKFSGIGLTNTKKRMDIIYKESYFLDIKECIDFYTCLLTVKL